MTTTTIARSTESTAAAAETAAAPIAAAAPTPAVAPTIAPSVPAPVPQSVPAADISAVPETPADLLKQWTPARRPLRRTVIAAAFVRIWDALTGPGMTEQERINRAIAEHRGFARAIGRNA